MENALRPDQRNDVAFTPTAIDYDNEGNIVYGPSGAGVLEFDDPHITDGGRSTFRSLGDSIFNSMSDGILVVGLDATIVRVNPAVLELTGFTESELIGKPIDILSRNRGIFGKVLARTFQKNSFSKRLETYCLKKDGGHFPVSVSASKIYDSASGSYNIVCVARDISRPKRLEAEARAISKIIHGVTTTANLDELLQLIHRTIKKIVYAENFFVALFDPQTDLLTMQFWVDKYDPMPPPLKVGRSMSAYVFRQGRVDALYARGFYAAHRTGRGRIGRYRFADLAGRAA